MKLPLCFLAFALAASAAEPGLLFHLSGDKGTTADFSAAGRPEPTYLADVTPIADGARGGALQCADTQLLAFRAPGNIYAQRGTLSFFWRSRYPVGPTPFAVFRVGYADHSSWDMVWLRIDYNGHGFDAFVTDASLSRTRVSVNLPKFPDPKQWTHLTFAWDETRGVRLYVDGKLAAKVDTTARYDAALDQFGPHSRIISPYQVQSDYNFMRGGDIDEVRIYDRMLDDADVATLAKGDAPNVARTGPRRVSDPVVRDEWYFRYGWNRPNDPPHALPAGQTIAVRKVEIHDAFDLGRWWWKANDGIRETTWPGVYNRSRLPGRHDYFTLPDWDCYVDSGKAVTFTLPNEPWNHLEISGAAWGTMARDGGAKLFDRPKGQEKTAHDLAAPLTGGKITFTNVEQEEPIGELAAYNVTAGAEPTGSAKRKFMLTEIARIPGLDVASLEPIRKFIAGRYPMAESTLLVGNPTDSEIIADSFVDTGTLPITQILLPNTWDDLTDGLDGIAIDLPPFNGKPTHGSLLPVNIQVKDPLWPQRNLLDFSFSVAVGGPKRTLWLDLRDRLLPKGRPLYLTVAAAGEGFRVGSEIRLVFKPREAARAEHELDRFTQVRDAYAMSTEEHPNNVRLDLYNRIKGDLEDLLRVNPNHDLGLQYAAAFGLNAARPAFQQPAAPAGVPLWAFRQVTLLGEVKDFVTWYVDKRQSAFGDFGGGISDDVDLTNHWPGVALMGAEPEKIKVSLNRLLDAAYKNGMFTRGLPTIQADELHSYEEGINCLAQNLILDYASPRQLERAMETARGLETVTGVNSAGHRHVRSSYYSATKMAEEEPWSWSKPYSYLVMQVPQLLVDYNGNAAAKKYLLELADGLLAHRKVGANGRGSIAGWIRFTDDAESSGNRGTFPWHVFWGPYKWTGERRYLDPIFDGGNASITQVNANVLDLLDLRKDLGPSLAGRGANAGGGVPRGGRGGGNFRSSSAEHFAWQVSGDKAQLEQLYGEQIQICEQMRYINTEGSLWIDRVSVPYSELQRARLGGVALVRNSLYPGHVVSWQFAAPATGQSVAILVPDATATSFKVIAYNLENAPVRATMTGWNIDPGTWEIAQGVDTNNDDVADGAVATRTEKFERSRSVEITFAPHATTILTFKLKTPGSPYWSRPDLGLDREDATLANGTLKVRVHSTGAVAAPASSIALRDAAGKIVATAATPALAAPTDLLPKTADVSLRVPAGFSPAGATVEIDPEHQLEEITTRNNAIKL